LSGIAAKSQGNSQYLESGLSVYDISALLRQPFYLLAINCTAALLTVADFCE